MSTATWNLRGVEVCGEVTQEGSEDREYCSQLFYLGQPNLCKIHFVVTSNIAAHLTVSIKWRYVLRFYNYVSFLQVVKNLYEKKGAILGIEQLVEFEKDSITVGIPEEGITIKGWKITPLISPVVRHPLKHSNQLISTTGYHLR